MKLYCNDKKILICQDASNIIVHTKLEKNCFAILKFKIINIHDLQHN